MAMELEPRTFLSASTDGFTNTSGLADGIKLYPSQFGRDLIYRIYQVGSLISLHVPMAKRWLREQSTRRLIDSSLSGVRKILYLCWVLGQIQISGPMDARVLELASENVRGIHALARYIFYNYPSGKQQVFYVPQSASSSRIYNNCIESDALTKNEVIDHLSVEYYLAVLQLAFVQAVGVDGYPNFPPKSYSNCYFLDNE